jgi:hypothetical protein
MKNITVREKIMALFCLTTIAIVAMVQITEPENIVINIIVGICAFITGSATGRATDPSNTPPQP